MRQDLPSGWLRSAPVHVSGVMIISSAYCLSSGWRGVVVTAACSAAHAVPHSRGSAFAGVIAAPLPAPLPMGLLGVSVPLARASLGLTYCRPASVHKSDV